MAAWHAGIIYCASHKSPGPSCLLPLLAFLIGRAVIFVEMVLLDIVDYRNGNQVAHAHLTPQEKSNLGAADVVLDELLDDVDVLLPGLQAGKRLVNIGATALHNERLHGISMLPSRSRDRDRHTPYLPRI